MKTLTNLENLYIDDGYWYCASPYSLYPGGLDAAYYAAKHIQHQLRALGLFIFVPIVHTHEIAHIGRMNKTDHELWMAADRPYMDRAYGLLVVKLPSWRKSRGIMEERVTFAAAGKPIYGVSPEVLEGNSARYREDGRKVGGRGSGNKPRRQVA